MAEGMEALIGRQVCIMTRAQRRYTGRLSGWDQVKRVVWVDDVHGHGTEGRCAAIGEIEQPANDQVFETIEFNGKDLVDLRLIDDEKKEDKPAPKQRTVVPEAQAATSRPPQQQQQEAWPPAPSQAFAPPPQQGGLPGLPRPSGPGGPGGPGPYGYNQYPQDRWAPPPPMGGPPHDPRQGPPPPPFGGYGMYGGPQYPPYGAPGGPNFPPPPGGRPFQHEPYPGYPPFPGQAPPGVPGQQQQFTPQPMAPVEIAEGRQPMAPLAHDRTVEPKTLNTKAPPPAAQASASTSQPKPVGQHSQAPPAQAKAAAPIVPTGPKNNGKVIPAMPLTTKPAAREPAKAPVTQAAPAAPSRSAVDDATQAATAAVAAAMAKLPPLRQQQQQQQQNGQQQQSNSVDHLARKAGEMRINDNTTRAPRHPNSAEAGFGGRGGVTRGGAPRGRGGPRQEPRKVEVPKDDFDFESSNAKFNKQDLVKEVIAGDVIHDTPPSGPLEVEPQETVVPASSYNKKSSFFDDLSSEAKDRADGVASGQTYGREWRGQEQKRNVETFGQGSVDNGFHRGGMRGRGRGRGGYRGRGGPSYANGQPGRGRGGYEGNNSHQPMDQ